jgi:hypothetical protein
MESEYKANYVINGFTAYVTVTAGLTKEWNQLDI